MLAASVRFFSRQDMSLLQSLRSFARCLTPMIGAVALMSACSTAESTAPNIPSNPAVETYASATGVVIAQMTKVNDNLYIRDALVGSGAEAVAGKRISVAYKGMLTNGQVFDQGTISFNLGASEVISGWDQGVVGMKVGGSRKLVIGSNLAYGNRGAGGAIPPNATLVFDVTLNGVQ